MGFNLAFRMLIDVSIPSSHHLCNTITEKLHKYTDLQEELIRTGNGLHITTAINNVCNEIRYGQILSNPILINYMF